LGKVIKDTKQKILVTGATGFIGLALCNRLVNEHFDVRVLLRNPVKEKRLPAALQAELVLGNLLDSGSLQAACADVDIVLHLAGTAHVSSHAEQSVDNDANFTGSANLIEAAIKQGVKHLVFLSSSLAAAAEINSGDITAYGRAKRAVEIKLLEAARQSQLTSTILRPVNVYGIGMKGNIAAMISLIHRGLMPRLPALHSRISLLGVEDLASAILLAANTDRSSQTSQIYTVTDGRVYPVTAIEEAIYQALGKRLPRWKTPAVILYAGAVLAGIMAKILGRRSSISGRTYRNLTTDNLFSNDEICAELGFKPSSNLYGMLPQIVEEIVENRAENRAKK
jgi:UDP-glucose 4-epimerase